MSNNLNVFYLLGIGEVIIDLLVKDVENHIQEVPVIKINKGSKP